MKRVAPGDCHLRSEPNYACFLASPLGQRERTEARGLGASMRQLLSRNPHLPPLPARARRPKRGSLFWQNGQIRSPKRSRNVMLSEAKNPATSTNLAVK
jgi:hypothetical protein